MIRKAMLMVLIVVSLLSGLDARSATLPSEEEVKGIQNLCGAGNIQSHTVKGNVDAAIANWRHASAGTTAEVATRNLAAALDQVKDDANLEPVYKLYVECVADTLKRLLSTGPGPGSTPDTVTDLKASLESNGLVFSFEVHTNYSGSRGSIAAVEVCAEQGQGNKCVTTSRPVSAGDDDVSRVRMPIRTGGFSDFPLDVQHPIDFKACMSTLETPGREAVRFGCRLSKWMPSSKESIHSNNTLKKPEIGTVTDADSFQWLHSFFAKYMSGNLPYARDTDCCFESYSWKLTRLDGCTLTYSLELKAFHSDGKPNTDELWNFAVDFRKLPKNAARVGNSRIADGYREIDIVDPTRAAIEIARAPQGIGTPSVSASFTMNADSDELRGFMISFERLRNSCAVDTWN